MATYIGKWPDYEDGYDAGFADAERLQCRASRLAAFGAIRRAAALARAHDRDAETAKRFKDARASRKQRAQAKEIRAAIRAAIGSGKA